MRKKKRSKGVEEANRNQLYLFSSPCRNQWVFDSILILFSCCWSLESLRCSNQSVQLESYALSSLNTMLKTSTLNAIWSASWSSETAMMQATSVMLIALKRKRERRNVKCYDVAKHNAGSRCCYKLLQKSTFSSSDRVCYSLRSFFKCHFYFILYTYQSIKKLIIIVTFQIIILVLSVISLIIY